MPPNGSQIFFLFFAETAMDSPSFIFYKPASLQAHELVRVARIAQLVEQRIENPRVGGSNPPPGTTFLKCYNELNSAHSFPLRAIFCLTTN